MKVGQKYKGKSGNEYTIIEVFGNCVAAKDEHGAFLIEKDDIAKNYTLVQSWHDITPDEFREWWGKEVWFWDNNIDAPLKNKLAGMAPEADYPYADRYGSWNRHASITKPE